jgi:pimeloyl-ACP methyl ester carboxylesterase
MTTTLVADGPTAKFAYRRSGPTGSTPLLLTNRFRGTIGSWDPALLDVLAGERDVIVFDNVGVGATPGEVPDRVEGMAAGAAEFLDAIGVEQVDVLGWSMGGFVAQALALDAPERVRRLVIAASGPGPVPDAPATPERVWPTALRPVNVDEDFLYLFFPETEQGRAAGTASLRRLAVSTSVSPEGVRAQLAAIRTFSAWDRLRGLTMPVLVANGAHDVMAHPFLSYRMAQELPDATLVIYPRAGHAFLFQHAEAFGRHVLEFLG